MTVLVGTHSDFLEHDPGSYHPEHPSRIEAVLAGIKEADLGELVEYFEPKAASRSILEFSHSSTYLAGLERFCLMGGGPLDIDTNASIQSWSAATLAAGAGIDAIERLMAKEAEAAFLAVRPPGHHATNNRAMGFCLINNVAVAAQHLVRMGYKVLILDFDAHHGNGTQESFYDSDRVLYLSSHQYPLYPGTGRVQEVGIGAGFGYTINIPLLEGSNGATVQAAFETVGELPISVFAPDWLIISAGFDAHFKDPLTSLDLVSSDFARLTRWGMQFVKPGRTVAYLEGGYDLEALRNSTAATVASLVGESHVTESGHGGKVSHELVESIVEARKRALGDDDPFA